jgi:hypothetical protein
MLVLDDAAARGYSGLIIELGRGTGSFITATPLRYRVGATDRECPERP